MDTVFITGLTTDAIIGIYDWERNTRQTVRIDLEMAADTARAAASDSIDDALNYKSLSERLEDFIHGSEFLLIETLAECIAGIVREEFGVPWVRLTLHKPGALGRCEDVGVIIERGTRA